MSRPTNTHNNIYPVYLARDTRENIKKNRCGAPRNFKNRWLYCWYATIASWCGDMHSVIIRIEESVGMSRSNVYSLPSTINCFVRSENNLFYDELDWHTYCDNNQRKSCILRIVRRHWMSSHRKSCSTTANSSVDRSGAERRKRPPNC